MITDVTQRWRDKRGVYRPAREVVKATDLDIALSKNGKVMKAFVEQHHYAGRASGIVRGFEIHWKGNLAGVMLYANCARQFRPAFGEVPAWLTLARLVLLDEVPANAETIALGASFAALRGEGYAGVVSFSDPEPRVALDGRVILAGHCGSIYQAHNGVYTGRSKPETKYLLPNGTLFESRTAHKVKAGDQGRDYAARILVENGATPRRPDEDPAVWVARWRAQLCRPFMHRGNHRYTWALQKRDKRFLPESLPYPKMTPPPGAVVLTGSGAR